MAYRCYGVGHLMASEEGKIAVGYPAGSGYPIAFFAILFTKRFPRGLFDFTVGVHRWTNRVSVYTNLQRDEYPPFSLR